MLSVKKGKEGHGFVCTGKSLPYREVLGFWFPILGWLCCCAPDASLQKGHVVLLAWFAEGRCELFCHRVGIGQQASALTAAGAPSAMSAGPQPPLLAWCGFCLRAHPIPSGKLSHWEQSEPRSSLKTWRWNCLVHVVLPICCLMYASLVSCHFYSQQ